MILPLLLLLLLLLLLQDVSYRILSWVSGKWLLRAHKGIYQAYQRRRVDPPNDCDDMIPEGATTVERIVACNDSYVLLLATCAIELGKLHSIRR
jgi:hypothetical protein